MNEKKYRVTLTKQEREDLEAMTTKGKASARSISRAHILLRADVSEDGPGWTDDKIQDALSVGLATVYRVRQAFVEEGLDLALRPRKINRDYQRKLNSEQEVHLLALACSKPPAGFARWSLRLLASRFVDLGHVAEISAETVRLTLKKTS